MSAPHPIPGATYRLQFNSSFTFRDAAALIPYLASLGITHCYASPYLRARPGSMHGYDIIDHSSLNPEIGSTEDYSHFVSELQRHGMGQILDIVPNHMGVMGSDNAWWLDVLENGESSVFADYFDIDWLPVKDELRGKILIPILGDQYGNILEKGELKLSLDPERGEFNLSYFHHRFPINPREYPRVLLLRLEQLKTDLGSTHEDVLELQSIATAFSHLPHRSESSPEQRAELAREKEVQKRRLATLISKSQIIWVNLEQSIVELNGTPGDPRTFDALHELIKSQAYRLAQWRVASDDINYRRFFDVNELAALRMENDEVFSATHGFILELIAQGKINGLRIDHPDGLYDPAKYLRQLQAGVADRTKTSAAAADDTYLVVEKILTDPEKLRADWPIDGTTGYEFANLVGGLFVDGSSSSKMERIYRAFIGKTQPDFPEIVYRSKKLILKLNLASELTTLSNALSRIALANRHTCDFTLNGLRSALAEIIANFPVYRTYISGDEVSEEDRRYIQQAISAARQRSRAGDLTIFDFIERTLLLQTNGYQPQWYRRAMVRFAMKFQQVTSAIMAKGLEDTAFYRYHRLSCLNEVGGNPAKFGVSLDEFHEANQERAKSRPHSMLATSTHDSKRSEDVRTRIAVLSEFPALWRLNVGRWRNLNRTKKRPVEGQSAPSRNDEYLLYQTLIGAWPIASVADRNWSGFVERVEQYMTKAIREAKDSTSWANPNTDYEEATKAFVRQVLERRNRSKFLESFTNFHQLVSRIGLLNSLSQTLLKLTAPGVPDIYQGNEIWDFSLVDPDNRRSVDYEIRRSMLDRLRTENDSDGESRTRVCRHMAEHLDDGQIKLLVTWKTLCLRKSLSRLFAQGSYIPIRAHGDREQHVCAFARVLGSDTVIVVAPRLWGTLLGDKEVSSDLWQNTHIDLPAELPRHFRNVFSGENIVEESGGLDLSTLLKDFPVALLVNRSSD